jgi:hypothetical protein
MTLPPVLAFGIPGVLVPFPPGPPPTAFKLGLPVPADPLPPGLFEFGDPPPHQTRRGATAHLTRPAANGRTAHPCRTHSGANCTTTMAAATAGERKSNGQCSYQQCES